MATRISKSGEVMHRTTVSIPVADYRRLELLKEQTGLSISELILRGALLDPKLRTPRRIET